MEFNPESLLTSMIDSRDGRWALAALLGSGLGATFTPKSVSKEGVLRAPTWKKRAATAAVTGTAAGLGSKLIQALIESNSGQTAHKIGDLLYEPRGSLNEFPSLGESLGSIKYSLKDIGEQLSRGR